ncbi:hypothetical protein CMUS01_15577, partial [Colletotrichum musicola]
IPISLDNGTATGPVDILASDITFGDDFTLSKDGKLAYVATNGPQEVLGIDAIRGGKNILAASDLLSSATSVALDRFRPESVLYVTGAISVGNGTVGHEIPRSSPNMFNITSATLVVTVYGLTTMQKATNYRRITWKRRFSHADDFDSLKAFIVTFGEKYEEYYKLNVEPYAKSFVVATFTATALATLNLLLFCVTLVCFGRALHVHRKVKLESAPAKVDEVARYYGHAPRQISELYDQTSYQHIAEPNGQGYSYNTTELYGRDPRYNTAELEAPKRRAELA